MESEVTLYHSLGANEAAARLQKLEGFKMVRCTVESTGVFDKHEVKTVTTITESAVTLKVVVDAPWWWSYFKNYARKRILALLENALRS